MQHLKQTYCHFDIVCENPKGDSVEIARMPEFFTSYPEIETSRTHVHPFYEIIWFKKGSGVHTVDFTNYPVADNTVFFIAPGQLHSFSGSHNQEGIVMKICAHLLSDIACNEEVLLKYNVFNTYDGVPFKKISSQCAEKISGLIELIENEMSQSDMIGHKDMLHSLVTMMLVNIERCQEEKNSAIFTTSRTAHRVFLAFRREIELSYRKMHTVKEYADKLNISTKTLTNYVAECSDFSPLEMINNRIILEAKRMLRYSNLMVKEIAADLGFDDPSYFNKFFRRLAHCSAADYRTPE